MHSAPPGFEQAAVGGAIIVARPKVLDHVCGAVRAAGSLHAYAAGHPAAEPLRGRVPAYRLPAPGGPWVVRHYHRGGAAAVLLGDRYLRGGANRAVLELWASERARSRGVPTPAVACVVSYPRGPFYRADMATLAVPAARDLAALTFGAVPVGPDELVAAWRAAGMLLRRAFVAGLDHPDLNLMNVLVQPTEAAPKAWLIDLDRARIGPAELPERRRRAVLARFHRSRRKLAAAADGRVPESALAAFGEALDG